MVFKVKGRGSNWLYKLPGSRKRFSTGTANKRLALRIEAQARVEHERIARGEVTEEELRQAKARQDSIESLLVAYERHLRRRGRCEKHVREQRSAVEEFCRTMGARLVQDVSLEAVYEWRDCMDELSPRTANKKCSVLKAMLERAVKDRRLARNPLKRLEKAEENSEPRFRALTDDELARLFAVADERGRGLWYRLAYYAGCRRSDLERMTWAQVDLDAAGGRGVLSFPKGLAKARRRMDEVAVAPELRPFLEAERQLPSSPVFKTKPSPKTVRSHFDLAGIEHEDERGKLATLHSLRVTLGTRLARAGVPPQVAMRIMRHSTIDLTMRFYTDLRVADQATAFDAITGANQHAPRPEPQAGFRERPEGSATDHSDGIRASS